MENWPNLSASERVALIVSLFKCPDDQLRLKSPLVCQILENIREDDIQYRRNIHANYANLLCITLARTHDPRYLKDIMLTKMCGDLFYYVDSNLLFEFGSTPNSRDTCISDTLNHYLPMVNTEPWFVIFQDWIQSYAKQIRRISC